MGIPMPELHELTDHHLTHILGLPQVLTPQRLAEAGSPLRHHAGTIAALTLRRFRLLHRAGVGVQAISGEAGRFAANVSEGRQPWPLSGETFTNVARLQAQVTLLDDVLAELAGALIEAGVEAGLHSRPATPPTPPEITP